VKIKDTHRSLTATKKKKVEVKKETQAETSKKEAHLREPKASLKRGKGEIRGMKWQPVQLEKEIEWKAKNQQTVHRLESEQAKGSTDEIKPYWH